MRALVADDSNVMRRVISGALRQAGVENVAKIKSRVEILSD